MLEQSLRHYYQLVLVDPILPALRDRITPLSITWLFPLHFR
ncbi:hypothetical protein [Legionella pneumophila]|nr:hypothetical protein [Legionella pneumophila]